MHNSFTEYKKLLQTLTIEEQLNQINETINSLVTKKHKANIKDNRYDRIKELKYMKNLILSKV